MFDFFRLFFRISSFLQVQVIEGILLRCLKKKQKTIPLMKACTPTVLLYRKGDSNFNIHCYIITENKIFSKYNYGDHVFCHV